MRIPTKYNEEHSECLIRSKVSNISPDDGNDDSQNVWAWTVGKTRIVSNVFAPHWGVVIEAISPSSARAEKRFVALQRVLDWDNEKKELREPCNHAEISIHKSKANAKLIAGNHKMVKNELVVKPQNMQRDDGSPYKVRDIAQHVAEVMASEPMDEPFSWTKNNCRDFVRHLFMNLGIVKRRSTLWGLDMLLDMRDYLEPAKRELCKANTKSKKHQEPCFCKGQMSWNFMHSCGKSNRCTWDEKKFQCIPKCTHAANQNELNCKNQHWGTCSWSYESHSCTDRV